VSEVLEVLGGQNRRAPQRAISTPEPISRSGHVRADVLRVRKILARLEIPCDLVNRPGRGYSLTFRNVD
jgi:hypothetical protein